MNKLAGLRNAALTAAAMLGRFGATKDNSPEAFQAGIEIEGTGPGKRASRHKVTKPQQRNVKLPAWFQGHQRIKSSLIYDALKRTASNHGRCTDWIRENRRRRAAGLPQLRVGQFAH